MTDRKQTDKKVEEKQAQKATPRALDSKKLDEAAGGAYSHTNSRGQSYYLHK